LRGGPAGAGASGDAGQGARLGPTGLCSPSLRLAARRLRSGPDHLPRAPRRAARPPPLPSRRPPPRPRQAGAGGGGSPAAPNQASIGGHADLGPLVGSLWFRPNIEIGFGDDVTTFALNGEVAWWFPRWKSGWRVYAGGGPALNIYATEHGGSDSRAGLNFLV